VPIIEKVSVELILCFFFVLSSSLPRRSLHMDPFVLSLGVVSPTLLLTSVSTLARFTPRSCRNLSAISLLYLRSLHCFYT
jgi:hypothetical protein